MNNFLSSWYRNLTALDNTPLNQEFSVVDPTSADGKSLSTVVLSVDPSTDGNKPTMVSAYYKASGVKLFEKKYQDDFDAQSELSSMATDLQKAAELSKSGKVDEAKNLVSSLMEKYKRGSDAPLTNPPPTLTMTQASLVYKGFTIKQLPDGDWQASQDELAFTGTSLDVVKAKVDNMLRKAYGKKLKRSAGITMQNLFFDTVDEAMDFQEKTKALQGPEGGAAKGQPLWDQMQNQKETPLLEGEEPEELAPSNLAPDFKQIEKDKAKQDKDIGKRIKEQVKTEVESALETKSASVFGKDQEELVEALRKNGRNWDEIKKIFVKELSYNEDDTSVFLDSIRQKEEGVAPAEGLPMPPKPPEDLVSPETHDKLVKEVEDKSEPKPGPLPEPTPAVDEIARADNAEIRKVADTVDLNDDIGLRVGDKVFSWGDHMAGKVVHVERLAPDASPRKKYKIEVQWARENVSDFLEPNSPNPYFVDKYEDLPFRRIASLKVVHEEYEVDPKWGQDFEVSPWKCSCGETLTTKNQGLAHFRKHHGKGKESSLNKSALNPLQEPPAVGQAPGQPLSAPVEENPTFDAPTTPEPETVEPELLEAPQQGDRVYVTGDYETGSNGFEGTMVSTYTSKGDEYAVIAKDDGDNEEVAMHRVVKASQKKVAERYYKKADFQGYSNYDTWGLALWLDNEQDLYNLSRTLAQEIKDPEVLAKNLKGNFHGLLEEKREADKSSVYVNWLELANDLLAEVKENEEYEKGQAAETKIEQLPLLNFDEEKNKIIDQLHTETDPTK